LERSPSYYEEDSSLAVSSITMENSTRQRLQ
jgi:hypothetical protein